jgi:hypothetical protein
VGLAGEFRGPQLKADCTEGETERTTQPLRIPDAERTEQAGHQEVTQVNPGDAVDEPSEYIGPAQSGNTRRLKRNQ